MTWYSKPMNDSWELSEKDQAVVDTFFKAKGLPEDVSAYVCEVDGRPTLYLRNVPESLRMAIGATDCEVPKYKKLTPYRNARDNLEIRD